VRSSSSDDGGNGAIITDVVSHGNGDKSQYYVNIRYSSPTFEGKATLRSNGNPPTDMLFPASKDDSGYTGSWTLVSFPVDLDEGTNVISITVDNDHQGPSFDYFTLCTGDETPDDQAVEMQLEHDAISFKDFHGQKENVKKDLAAHLGLSPSKVQLSLDRMGWERRTLSLNFDGDEETTIVFSFFARFSVRNSISQHLKTKLDDSVSLLAYLSDSNRTSLTFTSADVGDFFPLTSSPTQTPTTQTPTSLPTQVSQTSPTKSPTARDVEVLESRQRAMLGIHKCLRRELHDVR